MRHKPCEINVYYAQDVKSSAFIFVSHSSVPSSAIGTVLISCKYVTLYIDNAFFHSLSHILHVYGWDSGTDARFDCGAVQWRAMAA
jgi:hypothetical protein